MKKITAGLVGNSLTIDNKNMKYITGISISPKTSNCVMKIWNNNCVINNASLFTKEIDYLKGVFNTYESSFFELKAECESYFENLTGETRTTTLKWQDLINIELLQLIERAEVKAKPDLSNIRCAAFCEVLYEKKYIKQTRTRVKTMTQFAISRYGRDISKSLLASKKKERKNYKTHPIAGQLPINKCF